METERRHREVTKSEPLVRSSQTARKPGVALYSLIVNDASSPILRLGHTSRFGLQAKLTISHPGDQYEQEADRVAEQVMRMPDPAIRLQRKCGCGGTNGSCECEDQEMKIQRKAAVNSGPANEATPAVHDVLRMPGQPLDQSSRLFFESRFGHDFSAVRVHTDAQASESARQVKAVAYTVGRDIAFASGRYDFATSSGRNLLAHELTHVIQQGFSPPLRQDQNKGSALPRSFTRPQSIAVQRAPLLLQRGSDGDTCGGSRTCSAPADCAAPDPEASLGITDWVMTILLDTEAESFQAAAEALRSRQNRLGHTYVMFQQPGGAKFTYGFYPRSTPPNENVRSVPGCVVHPDLSHASCVDDRLVFLLTQAQYRAGLARAQALCRTAPNYQESYTCTSFAGEVAAAAGQTLPPMRGTGVVSSMMGIRITADNPNTLLDNIRAERERDPARRGPYWNNPCINRCESEFDACLARSRSGPMVCLAARSRCLPRCPRPR